MLNAVNNTKRMCIGYYKNTYYTYITSERIYRQDGPIN